MGKGMKNGVGGHHQQQQQNEVMKERAKNRVDDLQGIFCDLQSARKESRTNDVALLEEQVNQMLREWQSELNQPSPASSFQVTTPPPPPYRYIYMYVCLYLLLIIMLYDC